MVDVNVFSTDNGVEGLGYVYITSPQIVIVDTTLPKYSGREVLDFFIQNPRFHGHDTHVIVLHELSTTEVNLPADFYLINKDKPQAFRKLAEILIHLLQISDHGRTREIFDQLAGFVLHNSNEDDLLMRRLEQQSLITRFFMRIKWTWIEFTSSMILTLLLIIFGKPDDENSSQEGRDQKSFSFKYFPTLLISAISFTIISINFALFVLGNTAFNLDFSPSLIEAMPDKSGSSLQTGEIQTFLTTPILVNLFLVLTISAILTVSIAQKYRFLLITTVLLIGFVFSLFVLINSLTLFNYIIFSLYLITIILVVGLYFVQNPSNQYSFRTD